MNFFLKLLLILIFSTVLFFLNCILVVFCETDKFSIFFWKITQFVQKHTGTCGYEPLYCENKCGMKVQRRHLGQHKLGECAKRLVACRYCNKEFVFDTLGAHHAKCGRFPVACPHRCETAVLPREDLEIHLKDHCTTHLLSCTFKDAGCRFKVFFL